MLRQYLYFRPEYVGHFKCDGSKCNARCCKGWKIFIDELTYKKYSHLKSNLVEHISFNKDVNEYCVTLDEDGVCPFLTKKNLCRIQLKHGENFLSLTCSTYPRCTICFGEFSERALFLTCPVAAEMILFEREPMKFEFVTVTEGTQSRNGLSKMTVPEKFLPHIVDLQVAMISILQERTLTIDQRLIMLAFFIDRIEELSNAFDESALTKLIAAYESKKFLAEQVPMMLGAVRFNTKKFIKLMLGIFETIYGRNYFGDEQKFITAVVDTLALNPDENNFVSISEVAARYERLADARKNFLAKHTTFLENYLVNELFINVYPWKFEDTVTKNFSAFVTAYKVFELLMFCATFKELDSRAELLQLVNWFASQIDHSENLRAKIFDCANQSDDFLELMDSLLIA